MAALSLVPISAGAAGVLLGPALVPGAAGPVDLDSHFRYLSGLLLAIGLAFLATVPSIERQSSTFRILAAIVATGGVGRLLSLLGSGPPSVPHIVGLFLELVVVPGLAFWQAGVARRAEAVSPSPPPPPASRETP